MGSVGVGAEVWVDNTGGLVGVVIAVEGGLGGAGGLDSAADVVLGLDIILGLAVVPDSNSSLGASTRTSVFLPLEDDVGKDEIASAPGPVCNRVGYVGAVEIEEEGGDDDRAGAKVPLARAPAFGGVTDIAVDADGIRTSTTICSQEQGRRFQAYRAFSVTQTPRARNR